MTESREVKYPFKVRNKSSLIVQVSTGVYRSYTGTTLEKLRAVFPYNAIFKWDDQRKDWVHA